MDSEYEILNLLIFKNFNSPVLTKIDLNSSQLLLLFLFYRLCPHPPHTNYELVWGEIIYSSLVSRAKDTLIGQSLTTLAVM